jgi:hypothetical protein
MLIEELDPAEVEEALGFESRFFCKLTPGGVGRSLPGLDVAVHRFP